MNQHDPPRPASNVPRSTNRRAGPRPGRETTASTPRPASRPRDPFASDVLDHDCDHHVHVVLSGLTGPGRSSVGHLVANELGRPFVDSDSLVQLRAGREPRLVVATDGLAALRRVETAIADQVLSMYDAVVFAAPIDVLDGAVASRRTSCWVVCLDHPTNDRRSELADLMVDTDGLSAREVATRICDVWRMELRQRAAERDTHATPPLGLRGR